MPRKEYESYHYDDPDFEYTYPNSSTLRNKLEIRNQKLALKNEYQFSAERVLELSLKPIAVRSMMDVRAIHHYIFQDMYTWAGEYRNVNISKSGNAFMTRAAFETGEDYIDHLIRTYLRTADTKEKIAKQLAEILDSLNHMHPFREGNGRCQREVVLSLARECGYDLFLDVESDDDVYNRYMDGTVNGDKKILEELFLEILELTAG
ncbi:MAG: Fic family protein [Clostridiales Family XIII bacterium]|jgi:cell filamentation protein|nr:Fic family protein [Clostridiales Family XIII bacterium]